jgi:hypothetical protein
MPKKPKKPAKREDYQQIARRVLDTIAPDAEPPKKGKPAAGNKNPSRPSKR